MNIFFLTVYMMLWILGVCASYAFVMTVTKKGGSLSFLRRSSLSALLSYGASWFFGVLYYTHPNTIARIAKTAAPSMNVQFYTFFAQSRECIFLSFVLVPILAALLAVLVYHAPETKSRLMLVSVALTILGAAGILLAMMIA
jgi:hypothetical protein